MTFPSSSRCPESSDAAKSTAAFVFARWLIASIWRLCNKRSAQCVVCSIPRIACDGGLGWLEWNISSIRVHEKVRGAFKGMATHVPHGSCRRCTFSPRITEGWSDGGGAIIKFNNSFLYILVQLLNVTCSSSRRRKRGGWSNIIKRNALNRINSWPLDTIPTLANPIQTWTVVTEIPLKWSKIWIQDRNRGINLCVVHVPVTTHPMTPSHL